MSSNGASRGNPAIGDIVRSVAVLGVLILALWGLGQVFTNTPDRSPKAIDYASTVRSARPAAGFELLAPARRGPGANVTYTRSEAGLATLVTGEAPRAAVEDYVSSLSAS